MALIDIDSWITEYDGCERLRNDIQSDIALRNREKHLSAEYSKISTRVRFKLKQFQTCLDQLNLNLTKSAERGSITRQEAERRQRQIENLQSQFIHLQSQFKKVADANSERRELFDDGRPSYWTGQKSLLDDDDDDELIVDFGGQASNSQVPSVEDLRKQQIRIIENQNDGLDRLSKAISRQKHLALRIGDEVDEQSGRYPIYDSNYAFDTIQGDCIRYDNLLLSVFNPIEIIDDLTTTMENTGSRINNETRHVDVVIRTDSTGWYWVAIIALFLANIIVATL